MQMNTAREQISALDLWVGQNFLHMNAAREQIPYWVDELGHTQERFSMIREEELNAKRSRQEQHHPLFMGDILEQVFSYLDSPEDRRSVSEVCKQWYEKDRDTRKHVYIAFTYSVSPSALTRRFRKITSLKLKAKPRAYEFNLLPQNWGGHVGPWIQHIVPAYPRLSTLHLRRMEVSDEDLTEIACGFSQSLQTLKLDFCSGFSTSGLRVITSSCRNLKVLYLENSDVIDEGGEWLHELALHNRHLQVLNFQMANGITNVNGEDIKSIIRNCPNLTSLKLVEGDLLGDGLRQTLSTSTSVKELGVFFTPEEDINNINNNNNNNNQTRYQLPKSLTSISGDIPLGLYTSVASQLVKLDLMTVTSINSTMHHELIRRCPNLENLQVRTIIGDEGLNIIGTHCKKLKKIRVEEQGDLEGTVTHVGLTSLAMGCNSLQKLAIYVSDMSNSALAAVGKYCPDLIDFRFILTETKPFDELSELPLDAGFESILEGCRNLSRVCIYLRRDQDMTRAVLSDQGLARIGWHAGKLKALLLGCVGESDRGFLELSKGCRTLQRLEMRDCPHFTEHAVVEGARCMTELKLFWVQGFKTEDFTRFEALACERFRVVECTRKAPVQCLIYRSLAGPRCDCPEDVISPSASGLHFFCGACM